MATFYVYTYRPTFPEKGVKYDVVKAKDFSNDCLPPTLTTLFQVDNVTTKQEALAVVLEHAGGYAVSVYKKIGKSASRFKIGDPVCWLFGGEKGHSINGEVVTVLSDQKSLEICVKATEDLREGHLKGHKIIIAENVVTKL
jgi:hypothetical protein